MNQRTLQAMAVLLILGLGVHSCQADALDFWTWRNPYPTGNSISRLVHGGGNFLGVGSQGTIVTSPDGTNWMQQYSTTIEGLNDVIYANGLYVAVGGTDAGGASTPPPTVNVFSRNIVATSPDGAIWTQRFTGTSNCLNSVAFGNGLFVAVGSMISDFDFAAWKWIYSGSVLTSPDGINWSERFSGTNGITAVAYGNGRFVAAGTGGATFSSTDGITWTQNNVVTNIDSFPAMAYGNGLFVALGDFYNSGNRTSIRSIVTSADGITWTEDYRTSYYHRGWLDDGGGDTLTSIVFANGQFIVVGSGDYYNWWFNNTYYWSLIVTSTNGSDWTYQRDDGMKAWTYIGTVAHNGDMFVSAAGNQIFTSPNATNWTEQSVQGTSGLRAVTFGNDQFVAAGARYDSDLQRNVASIFTSPRGMSWAERSEITNSASLNGVVYGSNQYVAVADNGTILTSSNGFDWILRRSGVDNSPSVDYLNAVTYGNGSFLAVGNHYDYNSDWTAVTNKGLVLSSQDGINWFQRFERVGETNDCLYGVAFGNGLFVAVGNHYDSSTYQNTGILLTSPDGVVWTQRYSGTNTLQAAAFGNGRFVVAGNNGEILTSANGINWARQDSGLNSGYLDFQALGYGHGSVVALGTLDMAQVILTSPDGVNWTSRNPGTWGWLSGIAYGASNFVAVGGNRILQAGNLGALDPNPAFFIQPTDQHTWPGGDARFTVSADGLPPLRYQWRFNGQSLAEATNATLAFNSVSATDQGGYSVVVWNGYGSITSTVAQLSFSWPLTILATNRTPTSPEITPPIVLPGPYPQQLKTFVNGVLTTNVPADPNKMTIVLTHGWNSNPDAWVRTMANKIALNVVGSPNILIWDWRETAAVDACDSGQFVAAARQTPDQGFALGQALLSKLGTIYSNRIHFIGHSLGALVNGHAAIWVHNRGFAPTNTHMTLLDEAEVATDLGCVELLKTVLFNQWNPLAPKPYYYRPLPPKFGWADNYITAFGLSHPDAHNVILTNGFPANAASLSDLMSRLTDFHGYPCAWYAETVITDISAMGHRWSFERNGFIGAPSTNTVFLQSFNGSLWNLAQTNYAGGSDYLAGRFQKYRDALSFAITHRAPDTVQANGAVTGEMLATGPLDAFNLFIISLLTQPGASPAPQFRLLGGVHPNDADGGGGNENLGAYAWLPLPIPADAVSMSFDFRIEGDWQDDSLAAALNGTNVLLLAVSQVETNVTLNSGLVDVTPYAGHTNEFFVGIVGGTSTNALLTVQNVSFYTARPPSLQAQASDNGLKVSWPLTAQNFSLEFTTNLAATDSWTAVTIVPAVVDLQNTFTNPISGGARFFRLKVPGSP